MNLIENVKTSFVSIASDNAWLFAAQVTDIGHDLLSTMCHHGII